MKNYSSVDGNGKGNLSVVWICRGEGDFG